MRAEYWGQRRRLVWVGLGGTESFGGAPGAGAGARS